MYKLVIESVIGVIMVGTLLHMAYVKMVEEKDLAVNESNSVSSGLVNSGSANEQVEDLGGVFVSGPLTIREENGKRIASLDNENREDFVLDKKYLVDSIEYNRVQASGTRGTMCVPFAYTAGKVTGGTVYKIESIVRNATTHHPYEMTFVQYDDDEIVPANTPVIIIGNDDGTITFNETSYLLVPGNASYQVDEYITFVGTYGVYRYADHPEDKDRVFGFASNATDNVNVGQFVKASNNASVPPFKCYCLDSYPY